MWKAWNTKQILYCLFEQFGRKKKQFRGQLPQPGIQVEAFYFCLRVLYIVPLQVPNFVINRRAFKV